MTARVLVVDDHLPNIRLLEAKLTSEYYDVLIADSGIKAIETTLKEMPDIILLDVMMPGIDGFETCRRLKADPKTMHIPVVMVTALSEISDRVQGLQAGADDFLTKPINDLSLFARIRSLVRLKHMLDELRLRDQTGIKFGLLEEEAGGIINTDNAKIAIVDDDVVQAQHFVGELASLHAKVDIIDVPTNAVQKIIEKEYDLIIVNTQLMDVDGLRLCSQIRNHELTRFVPLLVLIEENEVNILVKGLDMGINDYLMSPIDSNELIARVTAQIKRKRYQDALKANYQQSISMAVTDSLTHVYNRRYFDVHFANMVEDATQWNKDITLLMLDIDHFKSINDTHGHQAGDLILQQLTRCMVEMVRSTDLVARYGGEEFAIVMPDTTMPAAMEVSQRIRETVERGMFDIGKSGQTIHCTVSIGGAILKEKENAESLISRADAVLYKVKESGRNQVMIDED